MARAHTLPAAALLFSALLIPSTGASANPILITSGMAEVTGWGPALPVTGTPIHLEGERGFALDVVGSSGSFGPASSCDLGCVPGQLVEYDLGLVGLDLNGTASLDGHSWDHIGGASDDAVAAVDFQSAARLPTVLGEQVTLTMPFSFDGAFTYGYTGTEIVTQSLKGRGTVTATLERDVTLGPGYYRPTSTVYTFSTVVPEPGTLTLLATGLVAGMRAAMVRRRSDARTRRER